MTVWTPLAAVVAVARAVYFSPSRMRNSWTVAVS